MWVLKGFLGSQWLRQDCVAVRYLTPYFGYIILLHVDWPVQCLAKESPKEIYQKKR